MYAGMAHINDNCCFFAGTLLYVYVGSLANDIGELVSGRRKVSPAITIVSAILSGIFIIAVFVVISVRAKRAISRCEVQSLHMQRHFGAILLHLQVQTLWPL